MADVTVLVVDDEQEIADLIEIHLKNENYRVIKLYDGTLVMDMISKEDVSLVLLDIMMPGIDGLTVCQNIRAEYNIPIIMISARSMDMDKILGLSSGADDYITKPFNPMELVARVKAQLRRFTKLNPNFEDEEKDSLIEVGGLTIDQISHMVTVYGEPVLLTPIEFSILFLLASNPNKVFGAEEIFETVWGEKYYEASNNTVMVHIRRLREKLSKGKNEKKNQFIKTIWGVGYKIEQ